MFTFDDACKEISQIQTANKADEGFKRAFVASTELDNTARGRDGRTDERH